MYDLEGVKFSRNTDPEMLKEILKNVYPNLERRPRKSNIESRVGYFSNDEFLGRNVAELITRLSDDLSETCLPEEFEDYPEYLQRVSGRKPDDRVFRNFSSAITGLSGFKKVTASRTKTKKTKKTVDEDIIIKTKETEMGLLDGKIQPVKIREIVETIAKRTTEEEEEITIEQLSVEDEKAFEDELEKWSTNIRMKIRKSFLSQKRKYLVTKCQRMV